MGDGFRSICHYLPVRNFPRACLILIGHLPKSKHPQNMTQSSLSMDTVPHSKPSQNARLRAVGYDHATTHKTRSERLKTRLLSIGNKPTISRMLRSLKR